MSCYTGIILHDQFTVQTMLTAILILHVHSTVHKKCAPLGLTDKNGVIDFRHFKLPYVEVTVTPTTPLSCLGDLLSGRVEEVTVESDCVFMPMSAYSVQPGG